MTSAERLREEGVGDGRCDQDGARSMLDELDIGEVR